MNTTIINLIFTIFSLYYLYKIISYGLYEINMEKNKFGRHFSYYFFLYFHFIWKHYVLDKLIKKLFTN